MARGTAYKPNELIGLRFSRLVVTERGPPLGRNRMWVCRCDCGTEMLARGNKLKSGQTKSCGCLARSESGINPHGPKRQAAEGAHRFVKFLRDELVRQQCSPEQLQSRSGVAPTALRGWIRDGTEPKLGSIEAALGALGYKLKIVSEDAT
jgi:hypothetical protein